MGKNSRNGDSHWADETAQKVIREKSEKDLYTLRFRNHPFRQCAYCNFREIISVELVVRVFRDMGKWSEFIIEAGLQLKPANSLYISGICRLYDFYVDYLGFTVVAGIIF